MRTAIIGAGNMGGSIARGLAKGSIIPASDIIVSNPSQGKLDELQAEFPALQITHDNQEAIIGAEFIILAVKPWLIKGVLRELKLKSKQIIISVAAGINFEELAHYVPEPEMTMFRIIPNTAISEMESMTLIASRNADQRTRTTDAGYFQSDGTCHADPRRKIRSLHFHGFLRNRLCVEIHPGCHASRYRNGGLSQRCYENGGSIGKGSSRTDTE